MKKKKSILLRFNSYLFLFFSFLFLLVFISNTSIFAFDIDHPGMDKESLDIARGIVNALQEEDDYIKFDTLKKHYSTTTSSISSEVSLDIFSSLKKFSASEKYLFFYNKILSFFRSNNLSFYNSNSYEQPFLKDDIDVFDDWDHIYDRYVKTEIITDSNQKDIRTKLALKTSRVTNDFEVTTSHHYFTDNNLVALVEGNDNALKNEIIVIGLSLKKYSLGMYNGSLYSYDIDQALNTFIFLNLVKNILDNKDKLKRSVMFVAFSDEYLDLSDMYSFSEKLDKNFNGAQAFLDYFNYYNSKSQTPNSIYTFINLEQLSSHLFLKDEGAFPEEFEFSSDTLKFLEALFNDINISYNINYTTNNETLESILKTSTIESQSILPAYLNSFTFKFSPYSIFKKQNINSLLFGSHPYAIHSNFKITPQLQNYIQTHLDIDKINNFIRTLLVNINYLSIRNPELPLSTNKNPCSIYFE